MFIVQCFCDILLPQELYLTCLDVDYNDELLHSILRTCSCMFSISFNDFEEQICHIQGQHLKSDRTKLFKGTSFSLKPMYFWILLAHLIDCSLICKEQKHSFLQRIETSKDSMLFISIPSIFTKVDIKGIGIFHSTILSTAWNSSGFTIISFTLNQSIAT